MPATPLSRQTIVITGATSGIGLALARKAARAGAAVALVARDGAGLEAVAAELRAAGGRAEPVVADVSREEDVARVVDTAHHALGGFDAWVNDASVGVYCDLMDLPTDEHRRVFDVNYWGVVYGSRAAVRYWNAHGRGGALINLGSVMSDVPAPLLGSYAASKHAVRGYTNSLRIELLRQRSPVTVTLIKPASIGTPFALNSRNHTDGEAVIPPPLYAPEVVADAILSAVVHPRREIVVGGAGLVQMLLATHAPALFERMAAGGTGAFSLKGRADRSRSSLFEPGRSGRAHADAPGRPFSVITALQTHPRVFAGLGLGVLAGVLIAGAWSRPDVRREVARELPRASRRARKAARRLSRRADKLARNLHEQAPLAGRRAAELAAALPDSLPRLGREVARHARRTWSALG